MLLVITTTKGVKGSKPEPPEAKDTPVRRSSLVSPGLKYGGKVGFTPKNSAVKGRIKKDQKDQFQVCWHVSLRSYA